MKLFMMAMLVFGALDEARAFKQGAAARANSDKKNVNFADQRVSSGCFRELL
jgi:hypothetical protein